jgi:hypothetical protein
MRVADELAGLLADDRGAQTIRAVQRLLRQARPPADGDREQAPPRLGRVGRWAIVDSPAGRGLRGFEAAPGMGSTWSRVDEVPGKGEARRVVLLGESAARGYLLDPVYTPASVLQQHLDAAADGRRYQCVDLAQTSIELSGLRELVAAAAHLDTDTLVMFAGNNWTISAYELGGPDDTALLARALGAGGYRRMRDTLLADVLEPQVRGLLADLLRLRERAGVHLVVVVPEFNLTGWSPLAAAQAVDVPMLADDALVRWYELRSQALAAVAAQRWDAVGGLTAAMVELDGGLSPVPGYLTGLALCAGGDHAAAREAFERSRDSLCGLIVKYLPRTPRIVQDLLVEFCTAHDVDCVDLRQVLAHDEASPLPDPEYFLDYCHLSDCGIERAMGAVAARITGRPAGAATPRPLAPRPLADDWTRAVSLLLAATYNAFCGQPVDVVRGYLDRALRACPRVRELMASLNSLLARPGPVWASPHLAPLAREPNAAVIFERLSAYRPDQSRLWSLRECLMDLVGPPEPGGTRGSEELLDIATTALGVGAVPNYTRPRCYLQATVHTTEVRFLLPAPVDGVLRLVHRRRGGSARPVRLALNGAELGAFVAGRLWATSEFPVPEHATRSGINLLRLTWPGPAVSLRTRLAADMDSLARGEVPYVLPLFGELYSLTFLPRGEGCVGDGLADGPPAAVAVGSGP